MAEKQVANLPDGNLFWRIESFASLDASKRAAAPDALVAEAVGKVWLFTLGSQGGPSSPLGTRVAEVGPIVRVKAQSYLLRINEASGPPGSTTPVHSHPRAPRLCSCWKVQRQPGPDDCIGSRRPTYTL